MDNKQIYNKQIYNKQMNSKQMDNKQMINKQMINRMNKNIKNTLKRLIKCKLNRKSSWKIINKTINLSNKKKNRVIFYKMK